LDVSQEQEPQDDSLEAVRLDVSQEQELQDDSLEAVRLDVPQELPVPDGSPALREHSALPRWQAALQDAHSAPRCGSQHAWLPAEWAWGDSPA
jgi:hypothetical protein